MFQPGVRSDVLEIHKPPSRELELETILEPSDRAEVRSGQNCARDETTLAHTEQNRLFHFLDMVQWPKFTSLKLLANQYFIIFPAGLVYTHRSP